MNYNASFKLEIKDIDTYHKLLLEEDFDFKTKDINININKNSSILEVGVESNSLVDLKIANSAIIKSLEIIEKTLNV